MSNESSAETTEAKTIKAAAPASSSETASIQTESLIYLGPNLPGSMLNKFTVYRNGMPKHLDKLLAECPDIERLFVPVAQMSETMEKINKTGTPYHGWFANVVAYTQKGVK